MTTAAGSTTPEPIDSWALLGLPGPIAAASFLTSPRATQYRLIVAILAERQATSLTGVGHDELIEEVRLRLPPPRSPRCSTRSTWTNASHNSWLGIHARHGRNRPTPRPTSSATGSGTS